jgi:hypothetical protein
MSAGKKDGRNTDRIAAAMREFLDRADAPAFERSVAEFVHTARDQNLPIERVVADLEALADIVERNRLNGNVILERTELRQLMLRGVLLAFYGTAPMEHTESRQRERRRKIGARRSTP